MNISNEYPVRIFKTVKGDNTFYSMGLAKKDVNGEWLNGYITCKFKKGVELDQKAKIYIKDAFLTFYLRKEELKGGGVVNVTVPYIFISDFETIEEVIEEAKVEEVAASDPYEDFGNEVTLEDYDLPF